jgi:hypothetical protein
MPPTAFASPTTIVLDLGSVSPTSSALREVIVPLGQSMKGGTYGPMRLVIAVRDEATSELIDLLAKHYDLPIFLAKSTSVNDVASARPGGTLTTTEHETLVELMRSGGWSTVSSLSSQFGLENSATTNRLVGLERKGYLFRIARNRRSGDYFVDPRVDMQELPMEELTRPPFREALLNRGITFDPYDRSPITLEGDEAKRAEEILSRRPSNK